MDATIAPRFMAKRGTLWKGEYRYLQSDYSGSMQGQYLPDDRLEHKRRSTYSLTHRQNLGYGFSGSLDLNGASDDTFFNDLANGSSVVAQTNLLRLVVGQPSGTELPDPAGSVPARGDRAIPAPAPTDRERQSRRPAAGHELRLQR
jgi:LPS-assembly protein